MLTKTHINLTFFERNVTIDTENKMFLLTKKMKLNFHGANYNRQSLNIPAVDNEIVGKYRGLNVTIHQHAVKHRHCDDHKKMIYRGVSYSRD